MAATIHTFPMRGLGADFTPNEVGAAMRRVRARSARWGAEVVHDEGRAALLIGPQAGGDMGAEDRYALGIVAGGLIELCPLDGTPTLGTFRTVEAALDGMDAEEAARWADG